MDPPCGIAEWLEDSLSEDRRTLVGIDHGFSFPLKYFEQNGIPLDWPAFLTDFQRHWPTDQDGTYADFVRDGACGGAVARLGDARWRRITELRAGAKSVFHFDVQGSVAKSTDAGLPWLLYLRSKSAGRVHFWPFDGWDISGGKSVVAGAYSALFNKTFSRDSRDPHQHDAYLIAAWMRNADDSGSLMGFFAPHLDEGERRAAQIEGWILGLA